VSREKKNSWAVAVAFHNTDTACTKQVLVYAVSLFRRVLAVAVAVRDAKQKQKIHTYDFMS
jgi:hypothetical protein